MKLTLKEMVSKIKSRELTSEELVSYYLKNLLEKEPKVNGFLTVMADEALAKAKEIDNRIANGEKLGALAGIPIGIKDNICTEGVKLHVLQECLKILFHLIMQQL